MVREACGCCGVQRCGPYRILQTPTSELFHVTHGAIHGKDAAGEFAIGFAMDCAAAIFDFDLYGPKLVGAVGHASGGGCVGNENGAFNALSPQEKFHHFRGDMNSIRNNVSSELLAGEHLAEDARLAMIQRTHRIKGMRGVTGTGFYRGLDRFHGRVGMADAHTDVAVRRFRDHLDRSGKLGRDCHHAHMTARGLPKAFKDLQRGLKKIFRRMDTAPFMTEKRSFEMNAEWKGQNVVATAGEATLSHFDRVG